MSCDEIRLAFAGVPDCIETDEGTRLTTHCLYPSFDPVHVYVAGFGSGYKVHDGGGAVRSAWDHGRELSLIRKMLSRQAAIYRLGMIEDALVAEVSSLDWVAAAISSVANASASAAHAAVERSE